MQETRRKENENVGQRNIGQGNIEQWNIRQRSTGQGNRTEEMTAQEKRGHKR